MNILIIAKIYHNKQKARAIQMRRVVAALIKYSDSHITLITEGDSGLDFRDNNLQIINIPGTGSHFIFTERLIDRLLCSMICLKESQFTKAAAHISEQLIRGGTIDLLLTVSTPFDSHLVGLSIKNKFPNLKWITFFSDLWPTVLMPAPYRRIKLLSKRELSFMKAVVNRCNMLLTPSQYALEVLAKQFDTQALFRTIPHCHDEDALPTTINLLNGYIVHSGFLHKERINTALIDAIKELGQEEKLFKGFIQVGNYHPRLKKLIKSRKCKYFYLLGEVPEQLSSLVQQMVEISIILEAPMKSSSTFVPSKITDSLKLNKKIVVITPKKSFLADFTSSKKGFYCCTYDKDEIKESILEALNSKEEISNEAIDYFHPFNVAKKYFLFFHSLMNSNLS